MTPEIRSSETSCLIAERRPNGGRSGKRTIAKGDTIEDYPEDSRGHSCLIFGRGDDDRPVHIVCAPKEDYLAIITAYIPDSSEWSEDFRARVKK